MKISDAPEHSSQWTASSSLGLPLRCRRAMLKGAAASGRATSPAVQPIFAAIKRTAAHYEL